MERGAKSAKAKVEARPTVTKKSRQVDTSTAPELKQRLAEALEQHAAVSEILEVISASPSDVQPVVDAVAERAARLCEAPLARVSLVDGDVLRLTAEYSLDGAPQAGTVPLPLRRSSISGRAVLDRATIHHDDVVPLLDSEYPDALNARQLGLRAVLAVPLMREGNAYGAIFLWRREPGLFSSEPGRIGGDVCAAGGDRHPQCAPLQRDEGGFRAADGDQRNPAGDCQLPW